MIGVIGSYLRGRNFSLRKEPLATPGGKLEFHGSPVEKVYLSQTKVLYYDLLVLVPFALPSLMGYIFFYWNFMVLNTSKSKRWKHFGYVHLGARLQNYESVVWQHTGESFWQHPHTPYIFKWMFVKIFVWTFLWKFLLVHLKTIWMFFKRLPLTNDFQCMASFTLPPQWM